MGARTHANMPESDIVLDILRAEGGGHWRSLRLARQTAVDLVVRELFAFETQERVT